LTVCDPVILVKAESGGGWDTIGPKLADVEGLPRSIPPVTGSGLRGIVRSEST